MRVTEARRLALYRDWCVNGHGYANVRRLATAHGMAQSTVRRQVAMAKDAYEIVVVPKGEAPNDHPNIPVGAGYMWGEHPLYPVQDWQHEVSNDDTRRGYWTWVRAKLEEACEDRANKEGKEEE